VCAILRGRPYTLDEQGNLSVSYTRDS
jgi:hypothetical protein